MALKYADCVCMPNLQAGHHKHVKKLGICSLAFLLWLIASLWQTNVGMSCGQQHVCQTDVLLL